MSKKLKTEHNGAKNGGGHWGKREEAKKLSNHQRREEDKKSSLITIENSSQSGKSYRDFQVTVDTVEKIN